MSEKLLRPGRCLHCTIYVVIQVRFQVSVGDFRFLSFRLTEVGASIYTEIGFN